MKLFIPVVAAALGFMPAVAAPEAVADIRWHGCQLGEDDELGKQLDEAGAECGEITVPLDYGKPDGRTITVAMSRLKATQNRVGALLLNGGGPGGIGMDMPLAFTEARKRYDLIGMDPRFVGRSTPLDCGWETGSFIRSAGSDRRGFERIVRFEADLAARCATKAPELLPYATTRNTARDMDRIREALGEEKLSYLGYSYGTYLGAVYMQMFPDRLDRVVLDGPGDPGQFGPRLLRETGPVNEAALRDWARWTAARDATYKLGRTVPQVLATVRGVVESAHRKPLRIGDYTLDEHIVPVLLFALLADDKDPANAMLASTVQTLRKAAGGSARPAPELDELLRLLLTGAESPSASAQVAIICGDRAAPRNPATYWSDIQRHRKAEPFFGAMTRSISPCAFWPNPPKERPTVVHNDVPALIVAATDDPRTIYSFGITLHRSLGGSRLLTLEDARRHGVYLEYGNACVDSHVNAYLATGELPANDLTCQG